MEKGNKSCSISQSISLPFTSGLSTFIHTSNKNIRKKQKYDNFYLSSGFNWSGNKNELNELCVKCEKVMNKSSLNTAKLRIYLETNHPHLKDKGIEYFKRKRD